MEKFIENIEQVKADLVSFVRFAGHAGLRVDVFPDAVQYSSMVGWTIYNFDTKEYTIDSGDIGLYDRIMPVQIQFPRNWQEVKPIAAELKAILVKTFPEREFAVNFVLDHYDHESISEDAINFSIVLDRNIEARTV